MLKTGLSADDIDDLEKREDPYILNHIRTVAEEEKAAEYELLTRIIAEAVFVGTRYKERAFKKWVRDKNKRINKLLWIEDKEKKDGRNLAALFRRRRRG